MSLRLYQTRRIIALNPETTARAAARAIESNNIGAVLIQRGGRIVGIATDRDLAVRVVGAGRDPNAVPISEVMSTPVATLASTDSQHEAIRLMLRRNIRRIPLVDGERLVGIVTLDDLLLDESVSFGEVAGVIASQIGEGGPATIARAAPRRRSAARAATTLGRMRNRLQKAARLETPERAHTALSVVLESLVQRLTPGEAKDFISQLPSLLQRRLRALAPGPNREITRKAIEAELGSRLDIGPQRAAEVLLAVGACISDSVSPGQIDDMRSQLPEELGTVLSGGA